MEFYLLRVMLLNFKKSVFAILCLASLVSCETTFTEVELPIPYCGDKIVLSGFISPNDRVEIYAQKTIDQNNMNESDTIKDINLVLYENDVELFNLITTDGYRFSGPSNFIPAKNNSYKVVATSASIGRVESVRVQLPEPVSFDSTHFTEGELFTNNIIYYRFNDNPNTTDYYYIKIQNYQNDTLLDDNNYDYNFYSYDIIYDKVAVNNIISGKIVFDRGYQRTNKFVIKVFNISEDMVKFSNSYTANEGSEGDPFMERPNAMYSNINNGFGLIYSYSCDTVSYAIDLSIYD